MVQDCRVRDSKLFEQSATIGVTAEAATIGETTADEAGDAKAEEAAAGEAALAAEGTTTDGAALSSKGCNTRRWHDGGDNNT